MLKSRILYVVALISVGLVNYYFNSYILDVLLFAVLMIIPLGLVSIMISRINLSFEINADKSGYKKEEEGKMLVKFTNKGRFLISHVHIYPYHQEGVEMTNMKRLKVPIVVPKESFNYEIPFKANYRGIYHIGVKKVVVRDYFNLFALPMSKKVTTDVLYYPNLLLGNVKSRKDTISEREKVYGIDYVEQDVMVDIRPYEYGDPLKKVHWKLSAKNSTLQVKKFSSNKEKKTAILVDTRSKTYNTNIKRLQIEDKIMEETASMVLSTLETNSDIRLVLSLDEYTDYDKVDDFAMIYKHLAGYEFNSPYTVDEVVYNYYDVNASHELSDTNNVYIITSEPSAELYNEITANQFGDHAYYVIAIMDDDIVDKSQIKAVIQRMINSNIHVKQYWM